MSSVTSRVYDSDGNWGTSRFNGKHLTSPVTKIHFCAHRNTGNLGNGDVSPTNHWTIFLELNSTTSVQLDVSPGGSSFEPGMVILESTKYNVTPDHSHLVSADVPTGITVELVLKLIIDKKRDLYKFTANQEGCRFWIHIFISDLVDAGIISSGAAKEVDGALPNYWKDPIGSGCEPRAMEQGTFYHA